MGTSSPSADQRRQGQGVGRGGRGQASRGRGGGRGVLHPLPAAAQPTGRHQKQEYNPQTNTPHWRARQAHGSDFNFRAHDGFQPTDRAADQPRGDSPWNSPFLVPTGPAAGGAGCVTPLFLSERGGWPIRRGRWAPRPAGRTCSGWPTAGCRRRGAADRAETGTQALARASADARHRDRKVPSNPVLVRGGEMRPEPPTPRGAPPPELL